MDPTTAGWEYVRFAAYHLPAGARLNVDTEGYETGIVVLGGAVDIMAGAQTFRDVGERADVWTRTPPYVALLQPGAGCEVVAQKAAHVVVAGARTSERMGPEARLIRPKDIAVEARGEGQTYRHIHHLLPSTGASNRLLLVEVYTPAGNWSSFPPHKHDTEDPPREAYLEETYYYQINPKEGFAFQRVYTDDLSFDEAAAPGDGDLVLVPRGYHPVAAMPGYDCYYLNVMAGPTKAWNFTVDARYQWLMNWKKPDVAGGENT